ncbi:hypothetical protein EW145_g1422 [Phellinidium pouzarii]|uniref:Uncharacterized protein n=1 Tax=Phellinidium pouzarii TaxID=167371 RepID=A0A4S4LEW5_9AGAM|nr:hypothetical protein EW145_g1422 [Phellinidium pouzarii]
MIHRTPAIGSSAHRPSTETLDAPEVDDADVDAAGSAILVTVALVTDSAVDGADGADDADDITDETLLTTELTLDDTADDELDVLDGITDDVLDALAVLLELELDVAVDVAPLVSTGTAIGANDTVVMDVVFAVTGPAPPTTSWQIAVPEENMQPTAISSGTAGIEAVSARRLAPSTSVTAGAIPAQ